MIVGAALLKEAWTIFLQLFALCQDFIGQFWPQKLSFSSAHFKNFYCLQTPLGLIELSGGEHLHFT